MNKKLKKVVRHAYENAPAFNRLMNQAGLKPDDIQSLNDLSKIPVTSKDELVKQQQYAPPFGDWLAVPLTGLRRIFISPGPIFDPQGHKDVGWKAARKAFKAVGIEQGDIVLNTFMYHLVPAGIFLDEALGAIGATIIPGGPGNSEYQAQIALKVGATGYVGTPSFLRILLNRFEAMNISREAIPFKKAFLTAEPYPPSLRHVFEVDYGLKTIQAYGTADLGIIAYERLNEIGLRLADHVIVEIVDSQSGQPVPVGDVGEVVVTTFSKVYPLIRLGTGDLSAFTNENKTHLKGWMGRVGDAVKVRGMFLHPLQLKEALHTISGVGKFQTFIRRVKARDEILLKVALLDNLANQEMLKDSIRSTVGLACRLKIDKIELLEPNSIQPEAKPIIDLRIWD